MQSLLLKLSNDLKRKVQGEILKIKLKQSQLWYTRVCLWRMIKMEISRRFFVSGSSTSERMFSDDINRHHIVSYHSCLKAHYPNVRKLSDGTGGCTHAEFSLYSDSILIFSARFLPAITPHLPLKTVGNQSILIKRKGGIDCASRYISFLTSTVFK